MAKKKNRMIGPQPKPKAPRRKRNQKVAVPYGIATSHLAKTVCSNLDPFCPHAMGAKLHDENGARSLTFQSRQTTIFTTDANGRLMVFWGYSPRQYYSIATMDITGVVTSWSAATDNNFYSTIGTTSGKWRVVSWGVHVTSMMPYNTASGVYIATEVTEAPVATSQVIGSNAYGAESHISPAPAAEFYFVAKPLSMVANNYIEDVTTVVNNNYTSFVLALMGAPASTAAFAAEVIINYEWIPHTQGSGYNLMTSPSAPYNMQVMAARSIAASSLPVTIHARSTVEAGHQVLDKVEDALEFAARAGGLAMQLAPMGRAAMSAARTVRSLLPSTTRMLTNG
jgi:hypothetical protein